MVLRICDFCFKRFAHRQSLFKHKKKCTGAPPKPMMNPPAPTETKLEARLIPILSKTPKTSMDDDNEIDDLQDNGGPPTDIATIDGAKYSGEKPKSEKTLVKIMDKLKIPHENRAQILKEETELDKKVRKKMKSLCNIKQEGRSPKPPLRVSMPHLGVEEKTLINDFSRLFQEMKKIGKDNAEELCYILDELRNYGTIDEKCFQTAFNAVEDLCN